MSSPLGLLLKDVDVVPDTCHGLEWDKANAIVVWERKNNTVWIEMIPSLLSLLTI